MISLLSWRTARSILQEYWYLVIWSEKKKKWKVSSDVLTRKTIFRRFNQTMYFRMNLLFVRITNVFSQNHSQDPTVTHFLTCLSLRSIPFALKIKLLSCVQKTDLALNCLFFQHCCKVENFKIKTRFSR